MPYIWLIPVLITLAAMAAIQLLLLYLFLTLKADIRRLEKGPQETPLPAAPALRDLGHAVKELQERLVGMPPATEAPPARLATPGINLTRRSQVLRLSRRGESAGQIAATLGVPLNEVELLLKVHQATTG
ncbi:MAG: hypothetical protein ACRD44_14265 [Bryobacteraceae bacterium]